MSRKQLYTKTCRKYGVCSHPESCQTKVEYNLVDRSRRLKSCHTAGKNAPMIATVRLDRVPALPQTSLQC